MATTNTQFDSAPVDIDYLINSGLLFALNREILHPFGIGLAVKLNQEGQKVFVFKDNRAEPEKMLFDEKTYEAGTEKYSQFTTAYGFKQIERRQFKLGCAAQYTPVLTLKR